MKKILIMIAYAAITTLGFAQIENIPLTTDSSVMMDKLYAGSLSGTMFSVDSMHTDKFTNVRFGAAGTWNMNKHIALKTLGVFHSDLNSQFCRTMFWVKITPHKLFTLQFGQMPTLSAEQRPNPATRQGQFETFTEAQIPGVAPGVKMNINPISDLSFGIGAAVKTGKPEYHANMKIRKLAVSGYYGVWNDKAGTAVSYYGARVYNTLVWKQDNIVSNVIIITLLPKVQLKLYADMGYDLQSEKLIRGETGLLKNFASAYIKGLFGLGYQQETKTVNGYFFVHL